MDRNVSSLSQWAAVTAGVGVGVVVGWLLRAKLHRTMAKHLSDQSSKVAEQVLNDCLTGDTKMAIVVRNDLKMGKGKACAQCSHAAVLAYTQAQKHKSLMKLWRVSGQRKVVLKVDTEEELMDIVREAEKAGLITSLIQDAGHTQVAAGSKTCVGVGPGPQEVVDRVTGHLRLY